MIASQKIGKSFMGALRYNMRKIDHADPKKRAELLDTNFLNLDIRQIRNEVDLIRALRPGLNKCIYHTSLNFHENDKLDNATLLKIAHHYLEGMGFSNNQYFIFRHHDASHPHLHLLLNRITFDGKVVSDANNYRRSELILRNIEKRYSLVQVNLSKDSRVHAPAKDELEMVVRTGKPSTRMLLQAKMKDVLLNSRTISELIQNGHKSGINFLFNQQSTGRISGITYFFGGFKIKGQHLGNQFKWAELIKQINYEQIRDSKTISAANSKTRSIYGNFTGTDGEDSGRSNGQGFDRIHKGNSLNFGYGTEEQQTTEQDGTEDGTSGKDAPQTDSGIETLEPGTFSALDIDGFIPEIQITDDADDEKVYGKRRRRGR